MERKENISNREGRGLRRFGEVGAVVEWVERCTGDRVVQGSNPAAAT